MTILQGSIQAPIICLEGDGQINFEVDCDNGNADGCSNCIDIPFWSHDNDLYLIKKSNSIQINHSTEQENSLYIPTTNLEIDLNSNYRISPNISVYILPTLRSTILII